MVARRRPARRACSASSTRWPRRCSRRRARRGRVPAPAAPPSARGSAGTTAASWLPVGGGVLHCVATWTAGGEALEHFAMTSRTLVLAPGEGLPGRVQATRAAGVDPRRRGRRRTSRAAATRPRPACTPAFAIPLARRRRRDGVPRPPRSHEPDEDLMATLASLGRLAGQFVEHRRAEAAVARERGAQAGDARRRAGRRDHDRRRAGGSSRSTPPSRRSSAIGRRRWSGASWARRSSRRRCASATAPGSRAAPGSCSASASRSPRCTPTAASSRSS